MMTVAEFVAEFLKLNGIKRVFGLPGGENVLLMEALRRKGVDFILFHHETAAGYAALVSGELTGRPGVCLSTVGPGAANLAAAAAAATLERSPMLAITAEIDSRWNDRAKHMKLDLQSLFGVVAKASVQLNAASIKKDLAEAWQLALKPPRGAVHIALPPDIAAQQAPADHVPGAILNVRKTAEPDSRLGSGSAWQDAWSLLEKAERLFLVAGLGVVAGQAQGELLELAERWPAPVAVTPKAKGYFPESHPLFTGCLSAYGDGPLQLALNEADLLLGVGFDSVDLVRSLWEIHTPLININLSGADDTALKPAVAISGDIKSILTRIASKKRSIRADIGLVESRSSSLRAAIRSRMDSVGMRTKDNTVSIGVLIKALRQTLPEDAAVSVDVGVFKLLFLQLWPTDMPDSLFVANGLSAMGYAVPGALAIKLEQTQRAVVAVVGDGALLMYAGELATLSRVGLPMIVLIIVDEALSLIRLKQIRQGLPVFGTEFEPIDYLNLASSFGLDYEIIDGSEDPLLTFERSLKSERPVLIEARVDAGEYDHFK